MMSRIMLWIGKYIRHGAAWLIAGLGGWLLSQFGISVTEDQTFALVEGLTVLGMIVIGILYAWFEKLLKNLRWLDPEAWVEKIWASSAAERTADESSDVAAAEVRAA